EGVAEGGPEPLLAEHPLEVRESDEVALSADDVPVEDGNVGGVGEGEEAGEGEKDEERRDVEVGGELDVPAIQPVTEGDSPHLALGRQGLRCHGWSSGSGGRVQGR